MRKPRGADSHLRVTLRSLSSVHEPFRFAVVHEEAEGQLGHNRLGNRLHVPAQSGKHIL